VLRDTHIATFLRQGKLYDLDRTRASLSRDFCQASCGIEGFLGEGEAVAGGRVNKYMWLGVRI